MAAAKETGGNFMRTVLKEKEHKKRLFLVEIKINVKGFGNVPCGMPGRQLHCFNNVQDFRGSRYHAMALLHERFPTLSSSTPPPSCVHVFLARATIYALSNKSVIYLSNSLEFFDHFLLSVSNFNPLLMRSFFSFWHQVSPVAPGNKKLPLGPNATHRPSPNNGSGWRNRLGERRGVVKDKSWGRGVGGGTTVL